MPTLASTSRGQVSYILESTFGVTPGAGTPKDLRVTGETLDYAVTKEQSSEINASRAVSSVIATGANTSGGLQAEMQYAEYDPLMAAVLQSTWAAYGTNGVSAATFLGTFTATTITAGTATSGADIFTSLKKGQWFRVVPASGGSNGGKFLRVSKTVAPTTTVITLDAATPAVVQASIATSIATSRLTNGTTQTSYSIERKALDIGQFMCYRGQTPSKLSIGIQSGAISTLSIDFMGKDMAIAASTNLPGGGTTTPSQTYDIHSGVAGATCQFWYGGAPLTGTYVKSVTFDYDNALRSQDAICTLGSVGVAAGQIVCTLTMQVYFADATIYTDFLANAYPEVVFSSIDPLGNGYFFTLPRANISSVKTNMGAKDQDMMLDVTFACVRDASNADSTLRQVVFIDRVGTAVP